LNIFKKAIDLVSDNILGLISLLFPLKRKVFIFNSTHNRNYNFNSKFLFEYLNKNHSEQATYYFVINDESLRRKLIAEGKINIINATSFKNKWLILRSKFWICSTIEPPVEFYIKNPKRIVYHLGHGIPLKNIGMAEENISNLKKINRKVKLRMFTHVICYSNYFKSVMEKVFNTNKIEFLPFGQPRNDYVIDDGIDEKVELLSVEDDSFKILYCPTWRDYAKAKYFPFSDFTIEDLDSFLIENNIKLYTRDHPYYSFDKPLNFSNARNVYELNADTLSDITPHLKKFNLLITDYSSIFFDFYILEKKVLFIPYDLERYSKNIGFSKDYEELAYGKKIDSFNDFKASIIELIADKKEYQKELTDYLLKLNIKSSGNCSEHANYLIRLIN